MPSTLYNPDGSRTGLRINASVRRKRYMGGGDSGPLATRPTSTEAWELHERSRARRDFAAATPAAASPNSSVAPKPDAAGMLVPGPGGSSVWRTREQLEEETKARAAVRRKQAGGADFVGPMPSREMNQTKTAKDKAKSRFRVLAERSVATEDKETQMEIARRGAHIGDDFLDGPAHWWKLESRGPQKKTFFTAPSSRPQTAAEWNKIAR